MVNPLDNQLAYSIMCNNDGTLRLYYHTQINWWFLATPWLRKRSLGNFVDSRSATRAMFNHVEKLKGSALPYSKVSTYDHRGIPIFRKAASSSGR